MFTRRTIIGTAAGSAIIAIGVIAFISSIGLQSVPIDDTYGIGESSSYRFAAPVGAEQDVRITGESFEVELSTPGTQNMPPESYKETASLQWTHLEDGESRLHVRNVGPTDLRVEGTVHISTDPIYYTYHVLVMISGVVILGFSAAFSVRKPRGF